MKRPIAIVAALCLAFLPGAPALAHAMLDHAAPRVGSDVSPPPREVVLWFTEKLEPAFSSIEVRDAGGALVSGGKARVDAADRTQLSVPLKALAPGTYKVIWRVLSVDTHRTQGNFTFRVGN